MVNPYMEVERLLHGTVGFWGVFGRMSHKLVSHAFCTVRFAFLSFLARYGTIRFRARFRIWTTISSTTTTTNNR